MTDDRFKDVTRALLRFAKNLESKKIKYLVIGAVPLRVYGRERLSVDVDFAVLGNRKKLLEIIDSSPYEINFPFERERFETTKLFKVKDMKTNVFIDILLDMDELGLTARSFQNSRTLKLGKSSIRIPTPEDYLVTKFMSRRPEDFSDIMSVLIKMHEVLDWKYLETKAKILNFYTILEYMKKAVERRKKDAKISKI